MADAADEDRLRQKLLNRFKTRSLGRFQRAMDDRGGEASEVFHVPKGCADHLPEKVNVEAEAKSASSSVTRTTIELTLKKKKRFAINGSRNSSIDEMATSSSAEVTRRAPPRTKRVRTSYTCQNPLDQCQAAKEISRLTEHVTVHNIDTQARNNYDTGVVVVDEEEEEEEEEEAAEEEERANKDKQKLYQTNDEPDPGAVQDCTATSSSSSSLAMPPVIDRDSGRACWCAWHENEAMKTGGERRRFPLGEALRQMHITWRREYKREAKEGDVGAICILGQMYLVGFGGLKRNVKKAYKHLKSAAKKGNSTAISLLEQLKQHVDPTIYEFFCVRRENSDTQSDNVLVEVIQRQKFV
eukprot:jgi/Bigna1/90348/estExt_fgenesh1_pg.C_670130